ncbi:hypothetical protein ENUP19_0125G0011 [Entamoeba nuttalli]|uniref:Uncharacterized protein n=1 Tax=Entamoeba nuttalli TaxID=412467 RepID=A0ABQ0DJC6_9EUKA
MNKKKEKQFQQDLSHLEAELFEIQTLLNQHQAKLDLMPSPQQDHRIRRGLFIGKRSSSITSESPPIIN